MTDDDDDDPIYVLVDYFTIPIQITIQMLSYMPFFDSL